MGVLRDTARAPQPPTNPPTGHQMSWQDLAHNDQICQFWAKFGRFFANNPKSFGTHTLEKPPPHLVCIVFWSGFGSNGAKMPIFGPECQFWAKFGRFWAQNPIFWGQGEKF